MPGVRLPRSPWSLALLAFFCAAVGSVWLGMSLPTLRDAYRSTSWPKVTGRVISSERGTRGKRSVVDLSLEYAVGGRSYQGQATVRSGDYWAAIRRHPPGLIDVHYDQSAPERWLVPTTADLGEYLAAGGGMVLWFLALRWLVAAWRWLGGAPPPAWFGAGR